ncbi:DASH complex subunit Dad1-domain-containing protein [Nemania sp. NC0429]|nr:DASH complex subunit Dad1-domain-containing protein [Nemania sp. NC0429]
MASHSRSTSVLGGSSGAPREKSHFEQQREALIGEIAMSFEHVLANINKLNRSLEAVVTVGNEFSSVEALWSQFENVMAKDEEEDQDPVDAGDDVEREEEGGGEKEREHNRQVGVERSTTPKGEPRGM